MNSELFEQLLFEGETSTLDFKEEQYPFAKAVEVDRCKILKDILGFANAWRRSMAYILVGVKDVEGGRGIVVGISEHLQDHSLQQFVNNLTNRPVRFHYEPFGFEGKQVGIISLDVQTRPIYLKRDYGNLEREKVYVRRGSSTDPQRPASPEEIAQMRAGSYQPAAELLVEFSHLEQDDALGTSITLDTEFCHMPAWEAIPDLQRPRQRHPLGFDFPLGDPMNRPNENYFRELSKFESARRLFRPIRLVVRNVGQVTATNVRTEMTVQARNGVLVKEAHEMPDQPKRRAEFYPNLRLGSIRSVGRRDPGEVTIDRNRERDRVEIDFGDLQPGRHVLSKKFFVGKVSSGDFSLGGLMFADNLPKPEDFTLAISISMVETRMTVDELCSLPT